METSFRIPLREVISSEFQVYKVQTQVKRVPADRKSQKQFFMKYIRVVKHNTQLCGTENYTLADEISKNKLKGEIHPLEDKFIYEKNMSSNVIESSYLQLDVNWKRINAKTGKPAVVLNQPLKNKKNMKIRSQNVIKYINSCAYKDSDENPDIQAYRNISYFKMSRKKKTTASDESKKTAKPKTTNQLFNGITKSIAPIAAIYKDNPFPSGKRYDSKILKFEHDSLDESQCTSTLKTKAVLQPLENKLSLKDTISNKNNAMKSYADQLWTNNDFNILNARGNKVAAAKSKPIHPLENKVMYKEKKGNGISEEIEESSLDEQYFKYESRKVNKIKKNKSTNPDGKKKIKKTNHPLEDKFFNEDSKCTENDKSVIKYSIFQLKNGKKYKIANALKKDVPAKLNLIVKHTEKSAIHPLEKKSFHQVHTSTKISDDTCKNSFFQYYPESKIKALNDTKSDAAIKTNRAVKPKAKSCVHPLGKKFVCRKNTIIHHVNKDIFTEAKPDKECQSLPLFCEICDIKVSGYEPLLDHFVSLNHNKNIQNPKLKDHIDFDEYDRRLKFLRKSISSRQENIYDCDFCSAFFRNRKQYNLHKKSGKHFGNISKSYQTVFAQTKGKIRSSRGI